MLICDLCLISCIYSCIVCIKVIIINKKSYCKNNNNDNCVMYLYACTASIIIDII